MTHALSPSDLYQKLHTGNLGDLDFYVRVARDAKNVLELGCGWGRLAIPLAQNGVEVVALDNNKELLNQAREQAGITCSEQQMPDFIEADIRDFQLTDQEGKPRLFDRIFIAYNTLYALGGMQGARSCIHWASKHLSEEGELWFDVYPMDEFHADLEDETPPEDDDDEAVATWQCPDGRVDVYEKTDISARDQRLRVEYQARVHERVIGELKMEHHYLLRAQLLALLEDEGLELDAELDIFPDFECTSDMALPEQNNGDRQEQLIMAARHRSAFSG